MSRSLGLDSVHECGYSRPIVIGQFSIEWVDWQGVTRTWKPSPKAAEAYQEAWQAFYSSTGRRRGAWCRAKTASAARMTIESLRRFGLVEVDPHDPRSFRIPDETLAENGLSRYPNFAGVSLDDLNQIADFIDGDGDEWDGSGEEVTVSDEVTAEVEGQIASEVAEAHARIKRLRKELPAATKTADRLWRKLLALPEGKTDPKIDEQLEAARTNELRIVDALRAEEAHLARLADPATVESRIYRRTLELDKREETKMARKTNNKNQTPDNGPAPTALVNRIVKMIDGGMGLTAVAKKFNDEQVPLTGRNKVWHPQVVRGIYLKKTGKAGIKDVRKDNPVASKKVAAQPPKAATKLDKASKIEVKPDPKPTSTRKSGRKSTRKAAAAA